MYPSVERGGALLATLAGLDPHGISHALDGVAEADFLVDEKPRKPDPTRVAFDGPYIRSLLALRYHVNPRPATDRLLPGFE
jgi:hypothetical protein